MITMLVTFNISKGWDTWSEMAKGLEPQMNEVGSKIIWAGCNAMKLRFMSWSRHKIRLSLEHLARERILLRSERLTKQADVSSTNLPIAQIGAITSWVDVCDPEPEG